MLLKTINAFLEPLYTESTTMSTNSERLRSKNLEYVYFVTINISSLLYITKAHLANVTLSDIQTVPISFSKSNYILTPKDLLNSSTLIIYSATIIADSYIPNNQGEQESFMIVRQLYNKLPTIGTWRHLKIGSKKFHHILGSDIEWTYVSNNSSPSSTITSAKVISEVEFDKHLNGIKEKYTTLISQVPQQRLNKGQNVNLRNLSNNKHSNNKNEEDAAFISDNNPTELVQVRIQEAMPETKNKR
ncbi:27953_t:CDS:2, partial [Gigaspora margarita]